MLPVPKIHLSKAEEFSLIFGIVGVYFSTILLPSRSLHHAIHSLPLLAPLPGPRLSPSGHGLHCLECALGNRVRLAWRVHVHSDQRPVDQTTSPTSPMHQLPRSILLGSQHRNSTQLRCSDFTGSQSHDVETGTQVTTSSRRHLYRRKFVSPYHPISRYIFPESKFSD